MRQTKLEEFMLKQRHVCRSCGASFGSEKALSIHISKTHAGDEVSPLYPEEGVEVRDCGKFVSLIIRVKRTLWDGILRTAEVEGIPVDRLLISHLVNLTVYGLHETLMKKFGWHAKKHPDYIG